MSSNENIWLVKSGTHIMGPYSYDTVVKQLVDKTLSSRDEISQHLMHWLPIVDEPAFAKTIEELRLLSLEDGDDEHTEINTVANFNITEDLNALESTERRRFSTIESPIKATEPKNLVKEKVIPDTANDKPKRLQPMSYKEQNPKKSNSLLWIVVTIIVGALGFIVYSDNLKLANKSGDAVDYYNQGISYLKLSKYVEATSSFKMNLKLNPSNQKSYFYLAQAYISAGQQSDARSIINNENYTDIAEEVKSNLLGMTFLKEDEVIVAEKYFTKSLNVNANYVPALVNSSIANHKVGKNSISLMRLKKSLNSVSQYPEISFLYLMRLLDEYKTGESKAKLGEAQSFINKQFSEIFVMYQEFQLLSTYFLLLDISKPINSQNEFIKIIDNDPNEFSQMTFSPLIDNRSIGWKELGEICNRISSALNDLNSTALLSYCRYKKNKYQLAKDVLAINIEREPANPLYLALNSLYSNKIGEIKLSEAHLELSIKENEKLPNPFALPYILKVTNCIESSDQECLQKYSDKLITVKSNSLLAQFAKAELEFLKKNYEESKRLAYKASVQSENYLPIQNLLMNLGLYVK